MSRDRLFLDANILFSAAYRPGAGVLRLWSLDTADLVTSTYTLEEARRNLNADAQQRLVTLSTGMEVIPATVLAASERQDISLPEKDWPVLSGAVASGCSHLITGDVRHFGSYFGRRLLGVLVVPPAWYLSD